MICLSKMSEGHRAKLTDQEILDIYLDLYSRWKDKVGRVWMVVGRLATPTRVDGKLTYPCRAVRLVNLNNEVDIEVELPLVASRVRNLEMVRVEETERQLKLVE